MSYRRPHYHLGAPPPPELGPFSQIGREEDEDNPGMHFVYGPPPCTLVASAGAGQVGAMQEVTYQVQNNDHHGYYLTAESTGPFLNVFGTGGSPMPFLVPIRTRENDIIYFDLQDISGAANTVYISVIGVEKQRR
jgi:hypothetical protein